MLNNSLDYLKSKSKKFAKENGLFDIVIYGSSVKSKEEPGDIDIALIFLDASLKKMLDIAQDFKKIIKKKLKNVDVKAIKLTDLFNKNFLAKQGILTEGFSLVDSQYLSSKIGFKGYALFTYTLKNLNHNEKTKFTYALTGRRAPGMIKKNNALHLGKGVIAVPIEKSMIFEDFLKKWGIKFKLYNTLISK